MTPRSARKPKSAQPSGKKGPVGRSPKKRVSKKGQPNGPMVLTSAQERFLETIIVEGMTRMRWSRAYAERRARIEARPAPKTALQRLERALGPDDGRRRRGGSLVVQGGSPGLGRRR